MSDPQTQKPDDDLTAFMAELEAFKTPDANDEQAEATAPASPAVETAPAQQSVDTSALELQRRQVEAMERQAAFLEAQMSRQNQEASAAAPEKPVWSMTTEELTPDEAEAYGQSRGTIEKLASKSVAAALERYTNEVVKPMIARNNEMELQLRQYQTQAAQTQTSVADAQLQAMVSHEIKDYEAFIHSNVWKSYMQEDLPDAPGISRHMLAMQMSQQGNLQGVAKMMLAAQQRGSGQYEQAQVAPGSGSVPQSVVPNQRRATEPKALPYSRFKEAMEQRQRGQLSDADYQKISNAYDVAALSGKVDYDK